MERAVLAGCQDVDKKRHARRKETEWIVGSSVQPGDIKPDDDGVRFAPRGESATMNKTIWDLAMPHRPIMPAEFRAGAEQLKLSPAVIAGNLVFLTGVTGHLRGEIPAEPEAQFRNAFDKIGIVLSEAGLTFASLVEMTSYHVGLRAHFDLFNSVRLEYLSEPYPAWTAVEVAGLRREGAVVEIRVIAMIDKEG